MQGNKSILELLFQIVFFVVSHTGMTNAPNTVTHKRDYNWPKKRSSAHGA
ncbi:unnamed protein product [Meloidogyne enterolobii]|uniref:Uncharacterized protein n=1 Tax=Meloidogyne enterolobii TaxID=390850 RepID=A0ACB0XWQ0_MELEN